MILPVDGIKLHRGNFAAIGQQIQPATVGFVFP